MSNLTEKMAHAALNARDYCELESLIDATFLDYLNECDMDETNCVNENDFANWFYDIVKDRFPNANKFGIQILAKRHADGYNNQDIGCNH